MSGSLDTAMEEALPEAHRVPRIVPMCPRCGYDQSGVMDSWKESCPLTGLCSECGLELDWKLVMDPVRRGPAWSYEHAPRQVALKWARTALMTLRPGRLFDELSMSHDIVVRRLVQFAIVSLLTWIVPIHLAAMALAFQAGGPPLLGWRRVGWLLFPYGTRDIFILAHGFIMVHVPLVAMPLLMSLLHATLGRARVRRAHLLRGFCYSLPAGLPVIPLLTVVLNVAQWRGVTNWLLLGCFLAWLGWIAYWWWRFVHDYLRLRWAWFIVGVLMIPTTLLVPVVAMAVAFLLHVAGVGR